MPPVDLVELAPYFQLIADELHDLFWLIFWFGLLGMFGTTVSNLK